MENSNVFLQTILCHSDYRGSESLDFVKRDETRFSRNATLKTINKNIASRGSSNR